MGHPLYGPIYPHENRLPYLRTLKCHSVRAREKLFYSLWVLRRWFARKSKWNLIGMQINLIGEKSKALEYISLIFMAFPNLSTAHRYAIAIWVIWLFVRKQRPWQNCFFECKMWKERAEVRNSKTLELFFGLKVNRLQITISKRETSRRRRWIHILKMPFWCHAKKLSARKNVGFPNRETGDGLTFERLCRKKASRLTRIGLTFSSRAEVLFFPLTDLTKIDLKKTRIRYRLTHWKTTMAFTFESVEKKRFAVAVMIPFLSHLVMPR